MRTIQTIGTGIAGGIVLGVSLSSLTFAGCVAIGAGILCLAIGADAERRGPGRSGGVWTREYREAIQAERTAFFRRRSL